MSLSNQSIRSLSCLSIPYFPARYLCALLKHYYTSEQLDKPLKFNRIITYTNVPSFLIDASISCSYEFLHIFIFIWIFKDFFDWRAILDMLYCSFHSYVMLFRLFCKEIPCKLLISLFSCLFAIVILQVVYPTSAFCVVITILTQIVLVDFIGNLHRRKHHLILLNTLYVLSRRSHSNQPFFS